MKKEPLLYRISRPFIKIIMIFLFRPKFIGLDKIKDNQAFVLAGNHTNILDCWLLMSCTKRVIHFLAKDSLMKGWKKLIFKHMAIIPVNRSIHDKGALNKAIDSLKENKIIGIFPEGTINKTDDIILPFKIGAVKMAYEANTEIIPFVITGKYRLFKKSVQIEFLPKIKIKDNDLTKENDKLMSIIKKKLKEKRNQ